MTAYNQWQQMDDILIDLTTLIGRFFPTLFKASEKTLYYHLGSSSEVDDILIEVKGMVDPLYSVIVRTVHVIFPTCTSRYFMLWPRYPLPLSPFSTSIAHKLLTFSNLYAGCKG